MKKLIFLISVTFLFTTAFSFQINNAFDLIDSSKELLRFEMTQAENQTRQVIIDMLDIGVQRWGFEIDYEYETVTIFDNIDQTTPLDVVSELEFTTENRNYYRGVSEYFSNIVDDFPEFELIKISVNFFEIKTETVGGFTGFDEVHTVKFNYDILVKDNVNNNFISRENQEIIHPVN
ncbi:MAG: hypothetical protein ACQESP_04635 [Candidatus Muiribacteriota bacterium]